MANSVIHIPIVDDVDPVLARLHVTSAGQVAAAQEGYVISATSDSWWWEVTIPEACVGIYRITIENSDGATVSLLYVWVEADDTSTYIASGDIASLQIQANGVSGGSTSFTDWNDGQRLDLILDDIQSKVTEARDSSSDWDDGQRLDVILDDIQSSLSNSGGGSSSCEDWDDGERLDLILDEILSRVSSIGSGVISTTYPVSTDGSLKTLVLGDDYKQSNSRSLDWEFDAIPGFSIGSADGKLGIKLNDVGLLVNADSSRVTDLGGNRWKVSFDIDQVDWGGMAPGYYDYSAEIHQGGEEVTIVRNQNQRSRVLLVEKQTNS